MTLKVETLSTDEGPGEFLTDERGSYLEVEFIEDLMALRQADVEAYENLWTLAQKLLEGEYRKALTA